MQAWLESCEDWLVTRYKEILGLDLGGDEARLRWLSTDSLTEECERNDAQNIVIEDGEIGWLLFLLPYVPETLEHQISQALGLRSRLLRESNYTGIEKAGVQEDQKSSWRLGLVWLVGEDSWKDWQHKIIELRRESGAAEELSFDAVPIKNMNVQESLDEHGLPRLLLNTRALLRQTPEEAESWLSADSHVSRKMQGFAQSFSTPRSRMIARELEEQAKSVYPSEVKTLLNQPRPLQHFRVQNFRNLDSLEITLDRADVTGAEAIILFGPNGTGKSSLAEALSLAAFKTSPLLERFVIDKDISGRNVDLYLNEYLKPLNKNALPSYEWNHGEASEFDLVQNEASKARFEGVILNQEDSIKFTELSRDELAERVLGGYSTLADSLTVWLTNGERRANEVKSAFTQKHGLNSSITRSTTAYNRLAGNMLSGQLQRPSAEFIDWMRIIGRLSGEDVNYGARLVSAWTGYHDATINRLADSLAKLQALGASRSQIAQAIKQEIDKYDELAQSSGELRQRLHGRLSTLHDQLQEALTQMETWGAWLAAQTETLINTEADTDSLKLEIENLAKERADLEVKGKSLRGRLDLLDQTKQYLLSHWAKDHPDVCPVCDSNVADRQGIESVLFALQEETNATIQGLRARHIEIQARQKETDAKVKAAGMSTCPVGIEDQARLKEWLTPFLPDDASLEDWLRDQQRRQQLKQDLSRIGILPEAPRPYADAVQESERLADEFISLAQEADRMLEDPQAFGEVRNSFAKLMQEILEDHLPETLGKVWKELTLTLTTASWLLPDQPKFKLEQRGKSLSVQLGQSGRYIRYIFNAAERHVLGISWFFTYYLARRRFEEAWILLDDPAQEMDQPSFRELARFWETLLRLHHRNGHPLTMIIALHQEERALDAARATDGKLYILGWQKNQEDTSNRPSVKKIVLLAPGYHPLKPGKMFSDEEKTKTRTHLDR